MRFGLDPMRINPILVMHQEVLWIIWRLLLNSNKRWEVFRDFICWAPEAFYWTRANWDSWRMYKAGLFFIEMAQGATMTQTVTSLFQILKVPALLKEKVARIVPSGQQMSLITLSEPFSASLFKHDPVYGRHLVQNISTQSWANL